MDVAQIKRHKSKEMLRNVLKTGFTLSFLPTDVLNPDNLSHATETEKKADLTNVQNETGWDRLKRMFEVDEFGNVTKEVVTVLHVGAMSLFVGALYGGINHSKVAYTNFVKNNQATAFTDHMEAKKMLQDAVTKSFGRGAFKWAWRLSLFCSTFAGVSTCISVYRGKTGILEYVTAGLVSGTLYKFNMGPRGWIVGGALGSALGLVAGCATLSLLKLTGMSMDEVRYWQYHWKKEREEYVNKGIADYIAKEEGEVMLHHYKKVGESGKTLDEIDKNK